MKKYWYFGVRLKESKANSMGRTYTTEVARWHNEVFPNAVQAAQACSIKMAQHPGLSYFVQGFERPLNIDSDGLSHGYLDTSLK